MVRDVRRREAEQILQHVRAGPGNYFVTTINRVRPPPVHIARGQCEIEDRHLTEVGIMQIAGQVALVTGGQRGLGRAFVLGLLGRGAARVYATARAPQPEDDARIVPLSLDVTSPDSVRVVAATADDVDIVVNNAGAMFPGPLLEASSRDVEATFEVNVFGALRVAQAFAPVLAERGGGALVDIHSLLSWGAGGGAYGASKAALWSLTNSLRIELAPQQTLVLGVHLGLADTDMVAWLSAPKLAPAQVAEVVLDGLENGDTEVLVDEPTRMMKKALSGPVQGLTIPFRS